MRTNIKRKLALFSTCLLFVAIMIAMCIMLSSCRLISGGDSSNSSFIIYSNSGRIGKICGKGDKAYVEIELPAESSDEYGKLWMREITENAFANCTTLKSVVIPEGYERIEAGAFKNCENLENVDLPSTIKYIAPDAFEGCYKLKKTAEDGLIYLDTWLLSASDSDKTSYTVKEGVTMITSGIFADNETVKQIVLPSTLLYIEEGAFSGCKRLSEIAIPKGVKEIPKNAFNDCTSLERVTMEDGLEIIGERAFDGCDNLKDVSIPESVTNIKEYAFSYNARQEDGLFYYVDNWVVGISMESYYNVTPREGTIGIAEAGFTNAYQMTSVVIPESVKYISDGAFKGLERIISITGLEGVVSIGKEAFKDCTGISTISFSSNLRVIGEAAFSGCTSLTSVGLESGLEKISSCAFLNCKELTAVGFSIPNTVNSVGAYAFNECNKLILQKNRLSYVSGWVVGFNSVVGTGGANDGLTIYNPDLEGNDYASLKLTIESGTRGIAASALSGVRSIKSVTFPSSVKYIEKYAFGVCSIEEAIFEDKAQWKLSSADGTFDMVTSVSNEKKTASYLSAYYDSLIWTKQQ